MRIENMFDIIQRSRLWIFLILFCSEYPARPKQSSTWEVLIFFFVNVRSASYKFMDFLGTPLSQSLGIHLSLYACAIRNRRRAVLDRNYS